MDEGDNFFDYMSKMIDQMRTKIKVDDYKNYLKHEKLMENINDDEEYTEKTQ